MTGRDLKWAAGTSAIMALTVPFAVMPLRMATQLGEKLGLILYQLLRRWRSLGFENMEKMLPWLRRQPGWNPLYNAPAHLARELFENMGKLVAEISRLYHGLDEDLFATVEFRGMEHYEQASVRGNGVLFITGHCGNWELLALSFGAKYKPLAVVAKPMKKQYIDRLLEKMRFRHGNSVIYRDHAVREILTRLKSNGIVGILVDQVARPPHGVIAGFLGQPAWTTMMPVKVAMKSKAALVPIFIHREADRNIVTIYPEMALSSEGSQDERIRRDTDRLNRYIEEQIVNYPTQWNWFYRRWKGTENL
ncbi:lipid A biosynthesis (KDO)2-(lauroyl)-lipid IVA acyltransferase [Geobacter sp. OR-1]|uniref:lysophospholipid acyltransferase family protein n=1 Tax=Geobacter sp. OR-1 TaxID=1266765 RepID=UPI0005436FAF|nr:lysophospholipid acyltransferase family protein [Geobacter sp. OR-1]GAM09764.1 lipid A biosynthesis (KDO)2-(lauroyl)-lipid IVA acyltransferase [Geobacter sp. OR-1]